MIPKNKKTLFWKLDETKDFDVNYLLWHKKRTIEGDVVKTIYYVCRNKLKFGCDAKLRTTRNLTDSVLNVFTNEVHSEECILHNSSKIVAQDGKSLRKEIKKYYDAGITRARDIFNFIKKDFLDLKIKQIYNVISSEKKKIKASQVNFTLADLTEICDSKTERFNKGKPFILAYEISPIRVLFTHDALLSS